MYSSLDRIDIVTKPDPTTGRAGYVLTDHRAAVEIEEQPELSVLFWLTRVLGARRLGRTEPGGVDVKCVFACTPPGFLADAVRVGGGSITVTDDVAPVELDSAATVESVVNGAFRNLAARVAAERGAALDEELLVAFEDETLALPPSKDDDEEAYWSALLRLAAVAGELLRMETGGKWVEDTADLSHVPFVFTSGSHTFNVADKANRFLDHGSVQRVSQMLALASDVADGAAEGPLLVTLKPAGFASQGMASRPLLAGLTDSATPLPIVVLGHDHPNTFAMMPSVDAAELDRLYPLAIANLASIEVAPQAMNAGGLRVLAITGNYYASEKILDRPFMRTLHRSLKADLLAAAIPQKGTLLVTSALVDGRLMTGFAAFCRAQFEDPKAYQPLSPVPFLVSDGEIVGVVKTEPAAAEASKPGFLARLFGRGLTKN